MKKIIIFLTFLLVLSISWNIFLFFEKNNFETKLTLEKNSHKKLIEDFDLKNKELNQKNEKIEKLEKDLKAKIISSSELTNENFFDAIVEYKLTYRDRCLLPVFSHKVLSDFWNKEEYFLDLLTIKWELLEDYYYKCDSWEEKTALEYILSEPLENTKSKPWSNYFEHWEKNSATHYLWKKVILDRSLEYLKKYKNNFSKENIEILREIFEKTRFQVEKENPETKKYFDELLEILK